MVKKDKTGTFKTYGYLWKKARKYRINISMVCHEALDREIKRIEKLYGSAGKGLTQGRNS